MIPYFIIEILKIIQVACFKSNLYYFVLLKKRIYN